MYRNFSLLSALLLILSINDLYAQRHSEDFILLKNSGLIRGQLIEKVENDFILLMLADSSFQRISWNEIYKTGKVKSDVSDITIKNSSYRAKEGNSVHLIIEPSLGLASYNGSPASFVSFNLIPSISFGEQFSFGISTGVRLPFGGSDPIIPLVGDFRITSINRVAPLLVLGAGYSMLPKEEYKANGFIGYVKGGVNVKSFRGGSAAILLGVDFGEQQVNQEFSSGFGGSFTFQSAEMVTAFIISLAFTI